MCTTTFYYQMCSGYKGPCSNKWEVGRKHDICSYVKINDMGYGACMIDEHASKEVGSEYVCPDCDYKRYCHKTLKGDESKLRELRSLE